MSAEAAPGWSPSAATRELTLRFLPHAAVLLVVLWPADGFFWGEGSLAAHAVAVWRVSMLAALVVARWAMRRATSPARIQAAWIVSTLAAMAFTFWLFGAFTEWPAVVSGTILCPFVTIMFVTSLPVRVVLAPLCAAVPVVAYFAPQPETAARYEHGWLLFALICLSSVFAIWLGQTIGRLIARNARQNERLTLLTARQRDLLDSVSAEMELPVRRLRASFEGIEKSASADEVRAAVSEMHAFVTEVEVLTGELLAHLRRGVLPNTDGAFDVGAVLALAVDDWSAVHDGVDFEVRVDGPIAARADRRAYLRSMGAVVERALLEHGSRVEISARRVAGPRPSLETVVRHDLPAAARGARRGSLADFVAAERIARRHDATLAVTSSGGWREAVLRWPLDEPGDGPSTVGRRAVAWGRATFRRAEAWYGPRRELPALPSFEEEERAITAFLSERLLLFAALQIVLLWPTDWLLFADTPDVLHGLAWLRLGTVPLAIVGSLAMHHVGRSGRSPYLVWGIIYLAFTAVTYATVVPASSPSSPLPYAFTLLPAATCLLVAPLRTRVATCVAGLATSALLYAWLPRGSVAGAEGAGAHLLLGFLVFTTATCGWWGFLIRELLESSHDLRRRIEAVLEHQKQVLQAVSHEVRTPLARARINLELIEDEPGGERAAELYAELDGYLGALEDLDAELRLYTEHGQAPRPAERFAAARLLASRASYWRSLRSAVRLEGIDALPELDLEGDPASFLRVAGNLIQNGLRHARERVVVSAEGRRGGFAVLRIEDDGAGIPERDRERVFEPFARLGDEGRTPKGGGVGLGLAIARRIVEQHGGAIRIEPSALGGAAVVTEWPLARIAPGAPRVDSQSVGR